MSIKGRMIMKKRKGEERKIQDRVWGGGGGVTEGKKFSKSKPYLFRAMVKLES